MSPQPDILVVDDDANFARVLVRSLQRRGFPARAVGSAAEALAACAVARPTHAVLDLMLGEGEDGLRLMQALRERAPGLRVLLLTGYASIATAVEAIKRGADDYLAKPADAAAVLRALGLEGEPAPLAAPEPARPTPWNRLEWEHLQRVLAEHGGNIAATARALGMHRRTLQRKLAKRPSPGGGEPPL
ncbi:response regulator transcription factor [Arenimonas caeni]|uniref:Two-component system response regulator n=1 Tax=Arenimonas caeni TaxID=2058085 RepID=A0A2P6MAI4_9GAMM|nr:response regulator [Arenimonas caeni]PRH83003.1 two-component system response regulator [Arenimonas caeni]